MSEFEARKERLRLRIEELEVLVNELDEKSNEVQAQVRLQRQRLNEIKTEFASISPRLN